MLILQHPPSLLKLSEMVFPWSDSNMTEVSIAMLSRRSDRDNSTSVPPVQTTA
ncbi:hypothetical protein HYC85_029514 [Camellia sinensis]|uniref:Uncharacterized protein n=1 Tax=Camellia sinensis TaxID=4442 RepID=A0A7J7FY56_CAMSI|nr:hypothetical protein HYC85_029514 [Camellia sinensis]